MGLRPRFEILKQRDDEFFPLKSPALENPHRRREGGFPEGTVIPGARRDAYPGWKRYEAHPGGR